MSDQGTIASVLTVDTCPMEGKICVRSYPVQERAGATFLWSGDKAPSEFDDTVDTLHSPEELTSDEHSHFLCSAYWNTNYRYAINSAMDPTHDAYLYAASYSMVSGEKKVVMEVAEADHETMFRKTGQHGMSFDWTKLGEAGMMQLRLSIPYQPKVGLGDPFMIIGIVTPVGKEYCIVYLWRTRYVQGWQRDVWHFLYRSRLEGLYWDTLEQDRVVLESMVPEARDREILYQHDINITHIRCVLACRATAELAGAPIAMIKPVPAEAQHA